MRKNLIFYFTAFVAVIFLGILAAQKSALALPAKTNSADKEKLPTVSNPRFGEYKKVTRFVFDIDKKVKFKVFTLAQPNRIVIDIPESNWKGGIGIANGKGLVRQYRYGLFKKGTTRIVLEVKSPVNIQKSYLLSPRGKYNYRFVLDLKETTQKAFLAKIKDSRKVIDSKKPILKKKNLKKKKPIIDLRAGRKKKLIVIDPGHGGHDPGNLGVIKIPEKTLTLAIAKVLKKEFEKTGRYQVILTRNIDIYIKLGKQRELAHEKQADLFISLHLDAFKNKKVRGATVYTLSEKASNKQAAALAARENIQDIIPEIQHEWNSKTVQPILVDLMKRETMNFSKGLAKELVVELKKVIKVRKYSHQSAGFVVLKGLDIPSVLIEMAYLSNKQDAKIIIKKKTHKNISTAIVKAVDRFFSNNFAHND